MARAALLLLVCGCGRVGFEARTDAGADGTAATVDGLAFDGLALVAIDSGSLSVDGGFSFQFFDAIGTFGLADTSENLTQSRLRLFEDGVELGPAHAAHADIRNLGMGRFSHWTETTLFGDSIRFASSDNSDPRTNGRVYQYLP